MPAVLPSAPDEAPKQRGVGRHGDADLPGCWCGDAVAWWYLPFLGWSVAVDEAGEAAGGGQLGEGDGCDDRGELAGIQGPGHGGADGVDHVAVGVDGCGAAHPARQQLGGT